MFKKTKYHLYPYVILVLMLNCTDDQVALEFSEEEPANLDIIEQYSKVGLHFTSLSKH